MIPHSNHWSGLPEALAERILQQAFADGGCRVRDWVTFSLVCRYTSSALWFGSKLAGQKPSCLAVYAVDPAAHAAEAVPARM